MVAAAMDEQVEMQLPLHAASPSLSRADRRSILYFIMPRLAGVDEKALANIGATRADVEPAAVILLLARRSEQWLGGGVHRSPAAARPRPRSDRRSAPWS